MVALLSYFPQIIHLLWSLLMTRLKLDQWGRRWSFARGATKATHRTNGQSMAELTEALSEVDGLLAGINYLETLEHESEQIHFPPAPNENENANDSLPPNSAKFSWLGHLPFDIPELDASGPEERSNIEIRNLRKILNDKLINSNDNSRQIPRESQWATLRSLRMASMYHYKQFTRVTANSTSTNIRKLRKSYVTAKNMLDMGILTFRNVLHGQIPTTLVEIFAFASLSYVISKTLHSNGHIDESDILSGILDWRAAIVDESEKSAFDEIAKQLWPESKDIMHFIPVKSKELSPEIAGLRPGEGKTRSTSSSLPHRNSSAGLQGQMKITSHHERIHCCHHGITSMRRFSKRAHFICLLLAKRKLPWAGFKITLANSFKRRSRMKILYFQPGSILTVRYWKISWIRPCTKARNQILIQKVVTHHRRNTQLMRNRL